MPELPEVETTKRGIAPSICGHRIEQVMVRQPQLRWPVTEVIINQLPGLVIEQVERRAKYLLLHTAQGTLIVHLGMSGHLRCLDANTPAGKHDHIDIMFSHGKLLRYHDPRRFGAWLWTTEDPYQHPLLASLGPEPLSEAFNAEYLHRISRKRKTAIKAFIMTNQNLVGVGNIYANESLFLAGLHPLRAANSLTLSECESLVSQIKQVLAAAIEQGGTTLKDFLTPSGKPGYFVQKLFVYDRADQPCHVCGQPIQREVHFQRASYFCPHCQR